MSKHSPREVPTGTLKADLFSPEQMVSCGFDLLTGTCAKNANVPGRNLD